MLKTLVIASISVTLIGIVVGIFTLGLGGPSVNPSPVINVNIDNQNNINQDKAENTHEEKIRTSESTSELTTVKETTPENTDISKPIDESTTMPILQDDCEPKPSLDQYSEPIFLEPITYLSFDDSPFKELKEINSCYWHFEDYEDSINDINGLNIIPKGSVQSEDRGYKASVDFDDKNEDGIGVGASVYYRHEPRIDLQFNKEVLGEYPTHVGFVLTRAVNIGGDGALLFEGTGHDGKKNFENLKVHIPNVYDAENTQDDVFVGFVDKEGIKSITIYTNSNSGKIIMDHVQFW